MECVGYCANAAGAAATQMASNPNPRRILADRLTSLWFVDIVNGSFFIYPHFKQLGQYQPGAQSTAA
jgi:hypothetical protein